MEILVCISKTPDTTAKIGFVENDSKYDEAGVQFIMNPFDEFYALVRGIELKEALGGNVTVLNVGPAANDVVIRKALAIGADKAVRIEAEPVSALATAKQIASYIKDNSFDIIFFGKETIDYNGGEVGGMLAQLAGLPFVSNASKLEMEGDVAMVDRDIEGGVEKLKVQLPCVIGAAKGMAEQRIPNMRGIMMAKRKPLDVVAGIDTDNKVELLSFTLPEDKQGVKLIDPEDMDELVRLLNEEAKVI